MDDALKVGALGRVVRAWRIATGTSQGELAHRVPGVAPVTISHLETGRHQSLRRDSLTALAEAVAKPGQAHSLVDSLLAQPNGEGDQWAIGVSQLIAADRDQLLRLLTSEPGSLASRPGTASRADALRWEKTVLDQLIREWKLAPTDYQTNGVAGGSMPPVHVDLLVNRWRLAVEFRMFVRADRLFDVIGRARVLTDAGWSVGLVTRDDPTPRQREAFATHGILLGRADPDQLELEAFETVHK